MNVAIRVDASTEIGVGHAMRCLALADELAQSGARVRFLCAQLPEALAATMARHRHELARFSPGPWAHDADAAVAALSDTRTWDCVVVDHYALDARWESKVRAAASYVLAIDDLANRPHDCDVLLDQSDMAVVPSLYRALVPADARLLRGPQFALVRREFQALRPAALARRSGDLRRVLIFMGGGDPENETSKALRGIAQLGTMGPDVDVVIGAANPHRGEVQCLCARMPRVTLHIETNRMAEFTLAADLSIGAGGSAAWERCVLGLPSVTTIMADNQRRMATSMAEAGAHSVLGWWTDLNPGDYALAIETLTREQLRAMSGKAAGLCDGLGLQRVAAQLSAIHNGERANA